MEGHEESDQPEQPKAPGQDLAVARAARGLSTADVAAAINLRETVVKAIERDDFTLCGGDVYARGHIRAYARQVGLDAGPLLAEYNRRTGRVAPVSAVPSVPGPGDRADADPAARRQLTFGPTDRPLEPRGPNWVLIGGAALAVVAVILGVQLIGDLRAPARPSSSLSSLSSTSPTSRTSPTSSTSPAPEATTPKPGTSSDPGPTKGSGSTPPPSTTPDGVAVALRAVGDSWISVENAQGRTVFTGTLTKGQARRFSDQKSLRLVLGNAGAVQLTVNGQAIGSAGRSGEVVELKFGPGDPA